MHPKVGNLPAVQRDTVSDGAGWDGTLREQKDHDLRRDIKASHLLCDTQRPLEKPFPSVFHPLLLAWKTFLMVSTVTSFFLLFFINLAPFKISLLSTACHRLFFNVEFRLGGGYLCRRSGV